MNCWSNILTWRAVFLILVIVSLHPWPVSCAEISAAVKPVFSQDQLGTIEVFSSKIGEYDFKEVSSINFQNNFKTFAGETLKIKPGEELWLKVLLNESTLINHKKEDVFFELRNSNLDYIDFYRPTGTNGYMVVETGWKRPLSARQINNRCFVFILPANISSRPSFFRLDSHAFLTVPAILWTQRDFLQFVQSDSCFFGLVYGVLSAMTLFNFFIFLSLKDKVYLYYVGYIAFILLYQFFLNGHYMVWGGLEGRWGLFLLWASLGLMIFFACEFGKVFLDLKKTAPRLNFSICIVQFTALIIVLLGGLGKNSLANQFAVIPGVLGPVCSMAAGIVRLNQGFRPAKFYLIAWCALILGILFFVLKEIGMAPPFFSGARSVGMGSSLEAVLLSFALADRIRNLRKEKEMIDQSRRLYRIASETDGLTGLFNHRRFQEQLEVLTREKGCLARPDLALLMMDIDDFKKFNDSYGHQTGDMVLVGLADVLKRSARSTDLACRYGGEEFAVILSGVDLESAVLAAERIRKGFEEKAFNVHGIGEIHAAISIGVAILEYGENPRGLIRRADKALYEAKKMGKNRVATFNGHNE